MYSDLTNLLPPERQRMLARDFLLRILVVAVALTTILVLIAAALLIPTYAFLEANTQAKQMQLANIENSISSSDETGLSARLAALSSNAAKLTALANAPSASALLRSALAVQRTGITLSGFTYTPAATGSPGTFVISGISTTRDALRNYQIALQGASFASDVTLPVSAYADDTNIDFSITVTLAP